MVFLLGFVPSYAILLLLFKIMNYHYEAGTIYVDVVFSVDQVLILIIVFFFTGTFSKEKHRLFDRIANNSYCPYH